MEEAPVISLFRGSNFSPQNDASSWNTSCMSPGKEGLLLCSAALTSGAGNRQALGGGRGAGPSSLNTWDLELHGIISSLQMRTVRLRQAQGLLRKLQAGTEAPAPSQKHLTPQAL